MARKTNLEKTVETLSILPWWASLLIAVVGYLGLHALAQSTVPTAESGIPDMSALVLRSFAKLFQYIVPLVFTAAAVVSIFKRKHRRELLDSQRNLQTIKQLSWREFELMVGEAYRRNGYQVIETPEGPDGGVDLVARKDGEKYLIQCKHWQSRKVDVKIVREMLGVLSRSGAAGGVIVTTGELTTAARSEAEGQALELIDGNGLQKLLAEIEVISQADEEAPECPRCQRVMVKRMNKKSGEEFWGCPSYPSCHGTRSLREL